MYKISDMFRHSVITLSLISLLLLTFIGEAHSSISPLDRDYSPSERVRDDVHVIADIGNDIFKCSAGALDNSNYYDADAKDVNGDFKAILTEFTLISGAASAIISGGFGAATAAAVLNIQALGYRDLADKIYPELRICGDDWYSYSVYNSKTNRLNSNPSDFSSEELQNIKNYYAKKTFTKGSYKKTLDDWYASQSELSKFNTIHQKYREYLYGGKEYKGLGTSCKDPRKKRAEYLDGNGNVLGGDEQLYYMRGSGGTASEFACERFLPTNDLESSQVKAYLEAYRCCNEAESKYMCFEYSGQNWFCDTTKSSCMLPNALNTYANVGTSIYGNDLEVRFKTSQQDSHLICAETSNLFIFDFKVAGGTEEYERFCESSRCGSLCGKCEGEKEVAFEELVGGNLEMTPAYDKIKNVCSYNRHCARVGEGAVRIATSTTTISPACINFIGDTRNISASQANVVSEFFGDATTSSAVGFPDILGKYNGFTAPVVQCFKETFDNIVRNAGSSTICGIDKEYPDENDKCKCGLYASKAGVPYEDLESLIIEGCVDPANDIIKSVRPTNYFKRIQEVFRSIIIGMLTIYIMIAGFKSGLGGILVFAGKDAMKNWQSVMKALFKLSLVVYFTLGDGWQNMFFEGIYKGADEVSGIIMELSAPLDSKGEVWDAKLDGCQFDSQSLALKGLSDYAAGKEYLRTWDTLDCKVARYLGYSTSGELVSGLLIALATTLFIPVVGLFIFVALMFFGIFMLTIAIFLAHLFIMSSISIVVLVYISPLVIPTILFKRTSNMFKKWLSLLTSFAIQPVIATVYVAIFVGVVDNVLMGSAYYKGPMSNRQLVCNPLAVQDSLMCLVSKQATGFVEDRETLEREVGITTEEVGYEELTQQVNVLEARYGVDVKDIRAILREGDEEYEAASVMISGVIEKLTDTDIYNYDSEAFFSDWNIFGISIGEKLDQAVISASGVSFIIMLIGSGHGIFSIVATLMQAALVMFIFFQLLLKIPSVAAKLTGGMGIKGGDIGAIKTSKKVFGWAGTTGKVLSSPVRMGRKLALGRGKPGEKDVRGKSPVTSKPKGELKDGNAPIDTIERDTGGDNTDRDTSGDAPIDSIEQQ